jgi:N-terminal acetyltransferase B complex non-catalytic subunit
LIILWNRDRNWLEFLSVIDGIFSDVAIPQSEGIPDLSESRMKECIEQIAETSAFFSQLIELDSSKERSGLLALLELEKRARLYGLSTGDGLLVQLMERYFNEVGDKACCYGDLKPYLQLENEDHSRWTRFLESVSASVSTAFPFRGLEFRLTIL